MNVPLVWLHIRLMPECLICKGQSINFWCLRVSTAKLSETESILAPSGLDIFDALLYVIKLRIFEKATKFDEISIIVLTLLSTLKTMVEMPVNFVALSEYLNFMLMHECSCHQGSYTYDVILFFVGK